MLILAVWAGGVLFAVWTGPGEAGRGEGVLILLLFGRGACLLFCCLAAGRAFFFFFFLFAVWVGTGVHSLTGLAGSALRGPTTRKTKQQETNTGSAGSTPVHPMP